MSILCVLYLSPFTFYVQFSTFVAFSWFLLCASLHTCNQSPASKHQLILPFSARLFRPLV